MVDPAVAASLARASNLSTYTSAQLDATKSWVVGFNAGQVPSAADLAGKVNASVTGTVSVLTDTLVLKFDDATPWQTARSQLGALPGTAYFYPLVPLVYTTRAVPNDQYFNNQWHLVNTGQTGGLVGADANVVNVWDDFQGEGVVIGVIDSGTQYDHPDLIDTYRADLSFDYVDDEPDPRPGLRDENHGTAVAGVALAEGNNGLGVSGSAPLAELAAMRLITGDPITDFQIAGALSHMGQEIDLYNNSWGPARTGTPGADVPLAFAGPATLAAIRSGALTGRGGLGNIYLFAAGNDNLVFDNTNNQQFTNSRFVLAVAGIDHRGQQAVYSTPGASLFISGYTWSGVFNDGITTADRTGTSGYNFLAGAADGDPFPDLNYTSTFSGTSSATPLVSGVVALVLQANPNLTYRDVQYILAETAEKNDPLDAGWHTNAAGYHHNHRYGFGAIDAEAAVNAALSWTPVLPEVTLATPILTTNLALPDGVSKVSATAELSGDINVEWAEVVFNATHPSIGNLQVTLISPSGTRSVLAEKHFDTSDNYTNWVFSTPRNWGESSQGVWTIEVADLETGDGGTFNSFQLNLYGVTTASPRAIDDTATTAEDIPVVIDVLANDFDPDGALVLSSVAIAGQPANGTVQVNPATGEITYTPDLNFAGVDTFRYTVLDNEGAVTRAATVTVTVTPDSDPPVAVDDVFQITLPNPIQIDVLANDTDPDIGGTIDRTTLVIVTPPSHGSVSVDPGTGVITYTPDATFDRNDTFEYQVRDEDGNLSNVATVTVGSPNQAPVAVDDVALTTLNSDVLIEVLDDDTDADGVIDPSTVSVFDQPQHGVVVVDTATGRVLYTPDPNFSGSDSFSYTVSDNNGAVSNVAFVSITIDPIGVPLALNDEFVLGGFRALRLISLTSNEVGSNPLTAKLARAPLFGAVRLEPDGTFTYTQGPGFEGLDTFEYVLNDGTQDSNRATVRLVGGNYNAVRRLYQDLLGRGATDAELLGWSGAMERGFPLDAVVREFQKTDEYAVQQINKIYRQLLKREGEFDALVAWAAEFRLGRTLESISALIAASFEYASLTNFTDTNFVRGLYRDLLGRTTTPTAGEVNAWVDALSQGASRESVALLFTTTREYSSNLVNTFFLDYLARPTDSKSNRTWTNAMVAGLSRFEVEARILGSSEYLAPRITDGPVT